MKTRNAIIIRDTSIMTLAKSTLNHLSEEKTIYKCSIYCRKISFFLICCILFGHIFNGINSLVGWFFFRKVLRYQRRNQVWSKELQHTACFVSLCIACVSEVIACLFFYKFYGSTATWRASLMEQELLTLQEYMGSHL